MPAYSEATIERAAKVMKIRALANTPGMDIVCLKLNCEPTWSEIEVAKKWAKAFELACKKGSIFELMQSG